MPDLQEFIDKVGRLSEMVQNVGATLLWAINLVFVSDDGPFIIVDGLLFDVTLDQGLYVFETVLENSFFGEKSHGFNDVAVAIVMSIGKTF
mgnify:CR=1 FL=1|jgi:hypothetical protein